MPNSCKRKRLQGFVRKLLPFGTRQPPSRSARREARRDWRAEAALTDVDRALREAREVDQATALMSAPYHTSFTLILRGSFATAPTQLNELVALAEEKNAPQWKGDGVVQQGCVLALTGKASDAVQMITSGLTASRSTGATVNVPFCLSHLAMAHAELGQFDNAWRCISEAMTAMEATKENWYEAEINRTAGEIELMAPQPDAAKAEAYFDRALSVARQQQAKSWELLAAMSMARLWRDQGKRDEARELLAPVYGWFTEGFDTLDLKQAKALLEELA
jgi:predicted ATPase